MSGWKEEPSKARRKLDKQRKSGGNPRSSLLHRENGPERERPERDIAILWGPKGSGTQRRK